MATTDLLPPFARNLRSLLTAQELTQQDLAVHLDVSLRSVSGWCLGESTPHRENMERIAVFFHRSPEWLLSEH
jgi:transcriptional regulator with XRE-family HTH domain